MIPALALLCVLSAAPLQEDDDPLADLAPPSGIAGLGGLAIRSEIGFTGDDTPHHLDAVYLFPDRARWRFQPADAPGAQRMMVYRLGEHAYELGPGATRSTEHGSDSRDQVVLQMELRRAAMLWPDGFAWESTESGALRTSVRRGASPEAERIGFLEASLGANDRPEVVRALLPDGSEREALHVSSWQEIAERTWPYELSLVANGETVWSETVLRVETAVHYLDVFFLPPDRRPGSVPADGGRRILSLDLIGITFRREALAEGSSWDAALARAEAAMEEAAEELAAHGLELDRVPTFELGPDAAPIGILLRLSTAQAEPPPGWTTLEDRPGLLLVLEGLGALNARGLETLERALPKGSRPGRPYARLYPLPGGGRRVQLALPLALPD